MIAVFTSAQTNRTEGENKPEFDLIATQQKHKQRSCVVLADGEPLDFYNLVPFDVAAKAVLGKHKWMWLCDDVTIGAQRDRCGGYEWLTPDPTEVRPQEILLPLFVLKFQSLQPPRSNLAADIKESRKGNKQFIIIYVYKIIWLTVAAADPLTDTLSPPPLVVLYTYYSRLNIHSCGLHMKKIFF